MSDFSLTLVLHFKTSKNFNGMAKVQIKSEKITPFGGIFFVLDKFDSILSSVRGQGTIPCPPILSLPLPENCTSILNLHENVGGGRQNEGRK